ncbi:MAG TPA: EAL domain-containing protein [Bryobacteraceae bacterium]|nr:EAL domain-containing protein [Bryobacteraceae bacterium]
MAEDCALCAVKSRCKPDTKLAFTAAPLLQAKIRGLLLSKQIEFTEEGQIFTFTGGNAITMLQGELNQIEQGDIRIATSSLAGLLGAESLANFVQRPNNNWFDDALVNDRFTFYFQPIVDTQEGTVFAHECLVRLIGEPSYCGGEIIAAATREARIHEFDSYCRVKAIRSAAAQNRSGSKVFVNFLPNSIYDPKLCLIATAAALQSTTLTPADVVFEVVESEGVHQMKHLLDIAAYYRAAGFGLALDDVGTGSNSLQMICDFKPDYIKLDRSLTSRLDDPMRLTAVRKLTELAHEFGVAVIAEGIETPGQSDLLQSIGIHLMQGWYFGYPAPQMNAAAEDLIRLARLLETEHSQAGMRYKSHMQPRPA